MRSMPLTLEASKSLHDAAGQGLVTFSTKYSTISTFRPKKVMHPVAEVHFKGVS